MGWSICGELHILIKVENVALKTIGHMTEMRKNSHLPLLLIGYLSGGQMTKKCTFITTVLTR